MNLHVKVAEPLDALKGTWREIVRTELAPLAADIDAKGLYPEAVLKKLGKAGAYARHLPNGDSPYSLKAAIEAMSIAGEVCLSTAFCMWCQDAVGWYAANSSNEALQGPLLAGIAGADILGGTGLSNPMKHFASIEPLRLKGKRVPGGYRVRGALPWVSNLGPDHYFGAVFELEDQPGHYVMAIIPCAAEGVTLSQNTEFAALDGTRTFAVQLRDVFLPDDLIAADPIDDYLLRIRAGFVLLQSGMAFGLIEGAIALMEQVKEQLGHVNKYLPQQPGQFREELAEMRELVFSLCETPFDTSPAYWRKVLQARLAAGETAVAAAHAAMLHQGARGYVAQGAAQRRLREAYFVAIVTPATKHLRKMLAEMPA
jgi:alkylation response protein AidB-like acyl-CoA dehydrogenase